MKFTRPKPRAKFWHALCGALAAAGIASGLPACMRPPSEPQPVGIAPSAAPSTGVATGTAGVLSSGAAQATSPEIPVDVHDAVWGAAQAPCTIVTFQDLQCPFCGKSWETLNALERQYGHDRLRFVYKHFPLPFHDDALPSARVAQSVYELKGAGAFRDFVSKVFALHGDIDDDHLRALALGEGIAGPALDELLTNQKSAAWKKLDDDAVLARLLSVQGTPNFFVNGVRIAGAQPIEEFVRVIDNELAAANALLGAGTPAQQVYAARVKINLAAEPEEERVTGGSNPGALPDQDATVYRVPVDHQPVEGPNDAPVTVVEFIDYQCPFCRRVESTRQQLLSKYGKDVRFVIRHNPLPFHDRALPAARLAIEAYAEKGNIAFWQAHRQLLEAETLDDAKLLGIAAALKLDPVRAKRAIQTAAHQDVIEKDESLAVDLQASGTPYFFINGVRLSGAQPVTAFTEVIDAQLKKARELAQKGTPAGAIYATLMKQAVQPDPFEHKSIPAPTAKNPQRGPASAPVVIDAFLDFQCPFCGRVLPTLHQLEREFPGKLRIVYRSRPLPFHKGARPAAEAALEAFRQRGNAGFWKMADRLFEVQGIYGAFEMPELEHYANEQGLDVQRFRAALSGHDHEAEIAADESIADREGINGTPACVINGLYISGAQPIASFKQAVRAALERH